MTIYISLNDSTQLPASRDGILAETGVGISGDRAGSTIIDFLGESRVSDMDAARCEAVQWARLGCQLVSLSLSSRSPRDDTMLMAMVWIGSMRMRVG